MNKSKKFDRHEYTAEEVSLIVKKKGKKTHDEADVAEAIGEANEVIPKGQALKVVTETYRHAEYKKTTSDDRDANKDPAKKQRKSKFRKPEAESEARLHLTKEPARTSNRKTPEEKEKRRKTSGDKEKRRKTSGDNEKRRKTTDGKKRKRKKSEEKERREYSQGQISLIVKKSKKTSEEQEIAAAVLEARQLAPTGKPVKVITESYNYQKQKRLSNQKKNKVVPTNDLPKSVDKSYKEIFDYKLLPPLGFYRKGDRYLNIREKYENMDDGRGVAMSDKYWTRQKNYTLRNLFVWPPKMLMKKLFWSFGYYGDEYETVQRDSIVSETERLRLQKAYDDLDSEGDELQDYDDEVFTLTLETIEAGDEQRKSYAEKMYKLTDSQYEEDNLDGDGDLNSIFTRDQILEFKYKEMLMYPWELDTRTVRRLNRKQLEDYKEVCDFCSQFIGPEDRKMEYIRAHMSHGEFKEFLIARERAKKKLVADLMTVAGKNPRILNEAKEAAEGPWEGWNLKSLLILEYGTDVFGSLHIPEHGIKKERKKKRNSNEQDKAPKEDKKINWTKGEERSSLKDETDSIGDNADQYKPPLRSALRTSNEEILPGDEPRPGKNRGKSVEIKVEQGEGQKQSLGKLRRGTKHAPKVEYDDDEDDDDDEDCECEEDEDDCGDEEDADVPGVIKRYSASQIDKNKFKTSRLKWTDPREPKAKEAELWNSLPHNPKLLNETMLLARLPADVSKSDLQELFPKGRISIEDPRKSSKETYATIEFPNYETCRVSYDRVRNVTYDGKGLVAIPKPANNSDEELQTFLRYCK